MNVVIRPITEDDIAAAIELLREFAVFEKLDRYFEVTADRLYAALFGPNAFVEGLMALDGEKAVAHAFFFPEFATFRGQRGYFLEDLFVTEAYRGRGLGEMMLRRVARRAAERGFERVDLVVLDWNEPAIEFYKKLGAVGDAHGRQYKFTDEAFLRLSA